MHTAKPQKGNRATAAAAAAVMPVVGGAAAASKPCVPLSRPRGRSADLARLATLGGGRMMASDASVSSLSSSAPSSAAHAVLAAAVLDAQWQSSQCGRWRAPRCAVVSGWPPADAPGAVSRPRGPPKLSASPGIANAWGGGAQRRATRNNGACPACPSHGTNHSPAAFRARGCRCAPTRAHVALSWRAAHGTRSAAPYLDRRISVDIPLIAQPWKRRAVHASERHRRLEPCRARPRWRSVMIPPLRRQRLPLRGISTGAARVGPRPTADSS